MNLDAEHPRLCLVCVSAVDFKKNGISSSQVLVDRTPVPKQTLDIDHRQAPDGSLYATVTKKDPLPSSQVSVNGPVLIRNGPVTSSSDSGQCIC